MRHVLSALVQNRPGVLAHISNMLASRGFNIDSLAVGETEHHDLSRMTFVVHGDDNVLDQVRKQLDKIVTVVRVDDLSGVTGKRWWSHGMAEPGSDGPAAIYWYKNTKGPDGIVQFTPMLIDDDSGIGTQFVVADI